MEITRDELVEAAGGCPASFSVNPPTLTLSLSFADAAASARTVRAEDVLVHSLSQEVGNARARSSTRTRTHARAMQELTQTLLQIFQDSDKDGRFVIVKMRVHARAIKTVESMPTRVRPLLVRSGRLDREEFTQALIASEVGFTEEEINLLGAEVVHSLTHSLTHTSSIRITKSTARTQKG